MSTDAMADVAAVAERLRVAMISPERGELDALFAEELSYGHSDGKVETKASFISDLLDRRSDFVTIAISDQIIQVIANVAIVRHTLAADTNDSGKPGKVRLKVLGVWCLQAGAWKMIARQAVRLAQ
jgi:hypothetical protein